MILVLPLLLAACVLHLVLFAYSGHPRRGRRLGYGLLMIVGSVPLAILGVMVGLGGGSDWKWVAYALLSAPGWLGLLSLLVWRASAPENPGARA